MNGSKSFLAMVLAAAVVGLGGMGAMADTITWNVGGGAGGNWDTATTNWTADGGGRNDNLYVDGDAVTFDDIGVGGSIALTAARAPLSTTVSNSLGNNYTFTGSGITSGTLTKSGAGILALNNAANSFSGITLSGGELQWSDTGRLGNGTISVSGNATLNSAKTTAPATMTNMIVVADGVTLNVRQNNPNNVGTSATTVGPISGGSGGNPITVNLYHPLSQGRVRLSPSTFVGDFYLRNRVLLENFNDNQLGDPASRLYIVGGFETYSMPDINRPVTIQGGFLGGAVFNGVVTNTGSPSVIGTIRFNNAASSVGGLYPNGGTVEFGFLPTSGGSRSDGGGGNGVTFRFLGDLVGNASFGISKNYAFGTGASNSNWLNLDVPSANASVMLTQAVSAYDATGKGGFRKDGAGTLTLANAANNNFGALQVRAGRLNVDGTINNATDFAVANLATLAVNGTVNGTAPTVAVAVGGTLTGTGTFNGAATVAGTLTGRVAITGNTTVTGVHAPGHSPGLQNVGSYTLDGGTLEIEIEGATAGNGAGFHDQVNVTGTVTLSNNPILTIVSASGLVVGDVLTIIANDGVDPVVGTFAGLSEGALFTAFGEKLTISYIGGDGNDVTLTRIPEPTSLALLALAGLAALRRRR